MLADAYTMLAFLRETPDVQTAVEHLFGKGTLVFDASAILPCIAEGRLPPAERRYTNLVLGALSAGMDLYVTDGVVNEIAHHLDSCVAYRHDPARGLRAPFVVRQWIELHGSADGLTDFIAEIRGTAAPVVDIFEFLKIELGLERIELGQDDETFTIETRGAVGEVFRAKKLERGERAPADLDILLAHDLEMYFGVLARRQREDRGGVRGYDSWWVTMERAAFQLMDDVASVVTLPSNPCMHPNFLANLLAIGPGRKVIEPRVRNLLPVALNVHRYGFGSGPLADVAAEIRSDHAGRPEYFLRRKTREAMAEIKAKRAEMDDAPEEPDVGMQLETDTAA